MKRFYNNTIMSGAFSKALRVLALLCVLLGVSSSAWADAGFHSDDAWNIKYSPGTGNSDIWIEGGVNNGATKDLGNLSGSLYLRGILAKTWKTNNGGDVCGVTVKYKIDNGSEQTTELNSWSDLGNSNGSINQQLSNENLNVALPTTSGKHTISFTFTAKVNTSGTGNCNSTKTMTGTITYTIGGGGGGGGDTPGGSDCNKPGNFYITGAITGGWGGSYWNQMQPTEDGKGHYYFWAQEKGDFKMSNQKNWQDDWWKYNINVSNECTTITKDANGGKANLKTANVYIKYNPCTGYIWTESVQCSEAPVYTVPEVVTIGFGESIDLSKICSSTSDATITFTKKSGTVATLNGTTLTAGQTAGTVVIKATQPLKTPYCSGSVEFSVNIVEKSIILLAEDAVKDSRDNWTLSAYLEQTGCEEDKTISEYGFFLCGTETNGGCVPTSLSHNINIKKEGTLLKGAHFTGVVNASDVVSDWYGYRSYVKFSDETYQLSSETRYFTDCNTVFGDTIYVTIDNTLTANSKCDFRFKSFDDAWATLKTHKTICTVENVTIGNQTQEKITLVKPVVMQVVPNLQEPYKGTEAVGLSGGDMNNAKAIFFRNINMNGGKELVVRSINKTGTRATLEHIAIRRSKNITLDYINITGTSKEVATADNAIDIDNGQGLNNTEGLDTHWNCATQGGISDDNITIKNCFIQSYGFTCVHVSAYDGVTFINNEIKALYDFVAADKISHSKGTLANNTALWGASAKFLNSQNITFVRNNFTGQHATSILLQGTQKVLIYNNVFWHENAVKSSANTVAIIRLMSFDGDDEDCASEHPVQNIGIYYNTMFLKNNDVGADYYNYFDFFRIGGNEQTGFTGNYYPGTIEFDYNNCYSYDYDVYGKNKSNNTTTNYLQSMSEDTWCGSFKYNNFWSAYEEEKVTPKPTQSAFTLGSGCSTNSGKNTFTNVKNLVCKTAAEEPGSLVIKGDGLNIGAYIKTDESGLLTSDMQMIDRLGNARPYDPSHTEGAGKYTVGAYQQSLGNELSKIIWNGNVSTDWDNRNNWYKPNGQLVTCVDILTEDLEVVIPAPNTTKYPVPEGGVLQYPKLPNIVEETDFSTTRATTWYGEEVTAGKGQISKPTQIANSITMEYGAALIGVEQLSSGETDRYTKASSEFVAERNKWLLVGTVVKPYNEDTEDDATDTRYIKSGDYYLDHLPAVYMRDAIISGEESSWNATFRDMDKYVVEKTVYAVKLPDQYGPYKLPAADYNFNNNTNYDPTQAHAYNFEGRFVNEANTPKYTDLAVGSYNLLVNTYPANIKVSEITGGSVLIYDFNGGSFRTPGWTAANGENTSLILAQHGFAYKPTSSPILEIPSTAFEESNTMHRSAQVELPEIRVMVKNDKYPFNSDVKISIDELKADAADPNVDASKLFTKTENKVPELYVIKYNEQWAGITLPNMDECIPLGLRMLAKNQTVTFSLNKVNGIDVAILEDRLEGKQYDLLAGETCTVSGLVKGDCEGRFFLNLGVSEDDTEEGDENVSTDVEDELSSESGIMIFGNTEGIVVSCSSDIELQTIYVNDMTGKTAKYNVSGQYAEIKLPVATGVYTVNVIGDTASKVGKVILK